MHHHHAAPYVNALTTERHRRSRALDPNELELLVRSAADGDDAAWTALVRRFGARIRSVARAHRLGAHDADDVAQATWLELLTHIRGIRDPAKVGAWLHTTARRESVRVATAARREQSLDEHGPVESAEPDSAAATFEASEDRAALDGALARLSPRQRALMEQLTTEAEPSYVDVAAALRIPVGSIGPTRARCLARLRDDAVLAAALGEEVTA